MKRNHYDPFKKGAEESERRVEKKEKDDASNTRLFTEDLNEKRTASQQISSPSDGVDITETAADRDISNPETTKEDSDQNASPRPKIRRNLYPVSSLVAAGFWIRLVAFLIDVIVATAFSSAIASPLIALAGWPEGLFPVGIKGFFFYLYFILSTYFTNGQTLGKMIMGIRVIHPEEEKLSLLTVFIREGCCRLIQTTFWILYAITAFTERKRNIGDFLADTYVVKDELYLIERREGDLFYAYDA